MKAETPCGKHTARPFTYMATSKKPTSNAMSTAKAIHIKPIGDRVLVKRLEDKEQVKGGIIVPDSAKEKPQEATVVALGTGKRNEKGEIVAFEVKVGDRVLISKYGGTEVSYEGDKFVLLREDDLLAIFGK